MLQCNLQELNQSLGHWSYGIQQPVSPLETHRYSAEARGFPRGSAAPEFIHLDAGHHKRSAVLDVMTVVGDLQWGDMESCAGQGLPKPSPKSLADEAGRCLEVLEQPTDVLSPGLILIDSPYETLHRIPGMEPVRL